MIIHNPKLCLIIFSDNILSDFKKFSGRNFLFFTKTRTHSSLSVQPKLQFTPMILNFMLRQIIFSDYIMFSANLRTPGRNFLSFLHMVSLLRYSLINEPKIRSQFYSKKAMNLKSKINLFCM